MEHTVITLPDTHACIIRMIHNACQGTLCSTPGANREVAPADLLSTAALTQALTSAAALERRAPGTQRSLLKAYSGIAVLRYIACPSL